MTTAYVGTAISEHLATSPEGFLIARDVIVARTAEIKPQLYTAAELGLPDDAGKLIAVYRSAVELFSRRAMASGNSKPVTTPHPTRFVDPSNTHVIKGVMQNIRPGQLLSDGERALLADLWIYDPMLIDQITSGQLREVSLGYECRYDPLPEGSYMQSNITINHCAIVESGRGGGDVRINDSALQHEETYEELTRRYHRQDIVKVAATAKPAAVKPARLVVTDSKEEKMKDDEKDELNQKLDRVLGLLASFLKMQEARSQDGGARPRRTLADGVTDTRRLSRDSVTLSASGAGPSSFHEALAASNRAYAEFSTRDAADKAFEDDCNSMGARMRGEKPERDCRPGLRRTNDGETENWADSMNETGRRMRS